MDNYIDVDVVNEERHEDGCISLEALLGTQAVPKDAPPSLQGFCFKAALRVQDRSAFNKSKETAFIGDTSIQVVASPHGPEGSATVVSLPLPSDSATVLHLAATPVHYVALLRSWRVIVWNKQGGEAVCTAPLPVLPMAQRPLLAAEFDVILTNRVQLLAVESTGPDAVQCVLAAPLRIIHGVPFLRQGMRIAADEMLTWLVEVSAPQQAVTVLAEPLPLEIVRTGAGAGTGTGTGTGGAPASVPAVPRLRHQPRLVRYRFGGVFGGAPQLVCTDALRPDRAVLFGTHVPAVDIVGSVHVFSGVLGALSRRLPRDLVLAIVNLVGTDGTYTLDDAKLPTKTDTAFWSRPFRYLALQPTAGVTTRSTERDAERVGRWLAMVHAQRGTICSDDDSAAVVLKLISAPLSPQPLLAILAASPCRDLAFVPWLERLVAAVEAEGRGQLLLLPALFKVLNTWALYQVQADAESDNQAPAALDPRLEALVARVQSLAQAVLRGDPSGAALVAALPAEAAEVARLEAFGLVVQQARQLCCHDEPVRTAANFVVTPERQQLAQLLRHAMMAELPGQTVLDESEVMAVFLAASTLAPAEVALARSGAHLARRIYSQMAFLELVYRHDQLGQSERDVVKWGQAVMPAVLQTADLVSLLSHQDSTTTVAGGRSANLMAPRLVQQLLHTAPIGSEVEASLLDAAVVRAMTTWLVNSLDLYNQSVQNLMQLHWLPALPLVPVTVAPAVALAIAQACLEYLVGLLQRCGEHEFRRLAAECDLVDGLADALGAAALPASLAEPLNAFLCLLLRRLGGFEATLDWLVGAIVSPQLRVDIAAAIGGRSPTWPELLERGGQARLQPRLPSPLALEGLLILVQRLVAINRDAAGLHAGENAIVTLVYITPLYTQPHNTLLALGLKLLQAVAFSPLRAQLPPHSVGAFMGAASRGMNAFMSILLQFNFTLAAQVQQAVQRHVPGAASGPSFSAEASAVLQQLLQHSRGAEDVPGWGAVYNHLQLVANKSDHTRARLAAMMPVFLHDGVQEALFARLADPQTSPLVVKALFRVWMMLLVCVRASGYRVAAGSTTSAPLCVRATSRDLGLRLVQQHGLAENPNNQVTVLQSFVFV